MSRERSRGQPETIEIGPVEPRELNTPGSNDGFACEHFGGIRGGFQPGIETGVELARNSVQRQEGFAQEEKVERHWMALQSQLLRDLERGLQRIASALRQRAIRMNFRLLSSSPRQDVWRWLVSGDAAKTECEERVAQRCGEPARSTPVQKALA